MTATNGTNGKNGNGNHNGLTLKQKVWLEEYLRCWNGAEAARVAGYAHPRQAAYANITKDYIQEAIHRRLSVKCMGADEVLMRLGEQARVDIGQFFREEEVNDLKCVVVNWDAILNGGKGHLVRSISFTKSGPKIEVYDAQHALAHLAKHHGLLVDRVEVRGDPNAPLQVEYVNNWRPDNPTVPAQGAADSKDASETVQLVGSGAQVAQDNAGNGNSGRGSG